MALDVGATDDQLTGGPSEPHRRKVWPSREETSTSYLRWVLPLVVVLFAAGLRFAYLPHPERIYFDETYYAENAAQLLDYGVEAKPRVEGDPSAGVDPVFVVHPPVGKWLIAAGIAIFGDDSLGWRAAPAAAGTLLVGVTYFVALRLFRRRGIAALTAFLLSIEGLALTMSRISMLDIFLALFVTTGLWCLLIDRDQRWALVERAVDGRAGAAPPPAAAPAGTPPPRVDVRDDAAPAHAGAHDGAAPPNADVDEDLAPLSADARAHAGIDTAGAREPAAGAPAPHGDTAPYTRLPWMSRPWLWLAGVAFGLALSTKWYALLAIAGAGLYLLVSELAWRRALTGRWWRQLPRLVVLGLASLVVVPLAVYLSSYVSWFANYEYTRPGAAACADQQSCDVPPIAMLRGWFGEQQEIFRFHRDLEVTHSYRALAGNWLITRRPVVYYYESCTDSEDQPCAVRTGNVEEIIGLGNPAVWWLAVPLYPWLLWAAIRRRDRVAAVIATLLLVQYLPWLVQSRPLFYFYALPLVPLVVLTWGWATSHLLRHPTWRWAPVAGAVLALGAFVYWSPVYYGFQITEHAWRMRMLMHSWI